MKARRSGRVVEVVGVLDVDTGGPRLPFRMGEGLQAKTVWMDLLPDSDRGSFPDFRERQLQEPVSLAPNFPELWAYRNKIVRAPSGPATVEETVLLIKHCVLRQETSLERVRREIDAMENLDRLPAAQRERIPEGVRLFVWQRDEGRCASCGGRERLEFDHIIPMVEGGSNSERNIQLLCEPCNRRKGRQV